MLISGRMLGRQLRRIIDQPLQLRLFTRFEPGTTIAGEYRFVELDATGGYDSKLLRGTDWQIVDAEPPAMAQAPVQEFRFDGTVPFRVLGAYLTQSDGQPIWAHLFDAGPEGFEIRRTGDIIPVLPSIRLGSLY